MPCQRAVRVAWWIVAKRAVRGARGRAERKVRREAWVAGVRLVDLGESGVGWGLT